MNNAQHTVTKKKETGKYDLALRENQLKGRSRWTKWKSIF